MPRKTPKNGYILPHDLTGERQRLALMSELLDPLHRSLLERLGLRPGWRCLEIGCGNGSVSRWLAGRVGPNGQVVATDLDLRYVGDLRAPNLKVRQLDILKDRVEAGAYDLVTGRAVLHHVRSPKKAVQHMVEFLKPGGVLLSIEPDFLPATVASPEPLRAFWQAWLEWSDSVGVDYFVGRKMPGLLSATGLVNVGAEGTTAFYRGKSPWAEYWLETLNELRPRLIESSYVTAPLLSHFNEPSREIEDALAERPEGWVDAEPPGARGATRGLKLKLSPRLPWMIAGLASVVAAIFAAQLRLATRPVDQPMMRFSVDLGPQAIRGRAGDGGGFFNPVISPDGTRFVFPAKVADGSEQLAMRRLDQSMVTILAGTEGAVDPFFSPDGQWIGFFASKKLKKIPLQGGEVVSLCDAAGEAGASWGENGLIIANLDGLHLFRVPAVGGEPQVIGKPEQHGERTWRWPQVLPGGENVLFTGLVANSGAAFDSANIEVLSLKSGQVKVVRRGGYLGRYLPSGHLIYIRQGTLYGAPFDLGHLEIHGAPAPLAENIADSSPVSFSRTGNLLYVSATPRVAPIAWLDSAGKAQRVVSPSIDRSRQAETPRLSPDGNRLALAVAGDLFVHDLIRGTATRLTIDAAQNRHPVWTPDGQHIVYGSDVPASDGEFGIWWVRGDGSSLPEKLFGERTPLQVFSISPDGRTMAFIRTGKDRPFEIWTLPLDLSDPNHPKSGNPEPLARESLSQVDPAFSPDGRWIAYVSTNGAGHGGQICVRPFPSAPSAGRWQVSESGAKFPVWSPNRKELFYVNSDNRIMVARYTANHDSFVPEKPRQWSPAPLFRPTNNGLWNLDIAPDGRRFLVLAPPESGIEEPNTVHATILLNFFDELRRRLPPT